MQTAVSGLLFTTFFQVPVYLCAPWDFYLEGQDM